MANYVDKLLVYNNGSLQKIQSSDSVGLTGDFSVGGNLLVSGDIVASDTVNVLIGDNFLDLSSGYTNNVTAKSAGLTFNVKAASSFTALTATDFVAGVLATSAPKFTCSAAVSTLVAGDIVQISGASVAGNNGLFIVESVDADTVNVYGIGGTSVPAYALFCQNQFTASTGNTATVTKVDLAVIAVADGVSVKDSSGTALDVGKLVRAYYAGAKVSDFNGTTSGTGWSEVGASTVQTLQAAYEGGNSITMSAAEGDLNISGGSGGAAINLTPNKSSQFVVSSANLTLGTQTGGALYVNSANNIEMTATYGLYLEANGGPITLGTTNVAQAINIGTSGDRPITIGTTSTGTGGSTINLRAHAGGITLTTASGGPISLNASVGASNFSVNQNNLTLATLLSGTINVTSAGVLNLDATSTVEINSSGAAISIGNDAVAQGINIGTGAAARTITLGNTTGATAVDILSGTGGVNVTGTLTGTSYVRTGQFATAGLPSGAFAGALAYNTSLGTAGQPVWHDGTAWQTFGSLSTSYWSDAGSGYIAPSGGLLITGHTDTTDPGGSNRSPAGGGLTFKYDGTAWKRFPGVSFVDGSGNFYGLITAVDFGSTTNYSGLEMVLQGSGQSIGFANSLGGTGINDGIRYAEFIGSGAGATGLHIIGNGTANDVLWFHTNGQRLHLGTGSDDYFDSNGTNLRTPGAFKVGAKATGSLPAASTVGAGGLVYDTSLGSAGQPVWSDGTSWQTFGSLAAATTLQGAYDASTSPATITLADTKNFVVAAPVTGSAGFFLNAAGGAGGALSVTDADLTLETLSTGYIRLNSVNGVYIDATASSHLTTTGGDLTVQVNVNDTSTHNLYLFSNNTGTGQGRLQAQAKTRAEIGSGSSFEGPNIYFRANSLLNTATVETVSGGFINIGTGNSNTTVNIASSTSSVMLGTSSTEQGRAGVYLPSAGGSVIVVGNVLYVQPTSGNLALADGDGSGTKEVVGVALSADVAGASDILVATVPGSVVPMKFTASPVAADIGSPVYLSTTAGQVTLTAPSAGRVYRLGVLISSSADSNSNYKVLYLPAFVADL